MVLVKGKVGLILGLAAVVALAYSLGGCGIGGGSDRPIVYVSEADGNPDVYSIDVETGEALAVKRGPGSEITPVWAPGGEHIAYVSSSEGNRRVIVIEADESGAEFSVAPDIPGGGSNEGSPRWNAEGDQLAYVSELNGQSDVFVSSLDQDGTAVNRTNRITSEDSRELLGDWSPDGQWLVFSRQGEEDVQGLWLRNPAGVNLLRLTDDADSDPVWSPDGDTIAFVRDDLGNNDIYLVKPEDGEDWRGKLMVERWLNSTDEEHSPAWAPDGDTLVFVSTRDGNPEIYTANANDDGPPQRLTINEASDTQPVWSPDGKRIAFVSDLFGETEILVMDADGAHQQRLTHNEVKDHSPDW